MRYRFPPTLADLPLLMQLGLLLLAGGGMLDALFHSGWAPLLGAYLGHNGVIAHLAILSGMVVMLLGLFARPLGGARPRR